MFQAYYRGKIVTVYAVDFDHDAFLIAYDKKFQWVNMSEFKPIF